MVFYRERDNERPPLSLILPHLYLGAETDVTQDALNARGISYVLSVSRCSPQPTFLPCSQYLRIPIDDSLRDDLLPWIPKALGFIDGAMSSGCAVLVHCAAGISRSPALAVAYIMYSLGMDLDHAYRFVKDRRPSISPNFNFLGQLQQFQGTLNRKSSDSNADVQPITSVDTNDNDNYRCTSPQSANQSMSNNMSYQGTHVTSDFIEAARVHCENSRNAENAEQKYFRLAENENTLSFTGNMQQERRNTSPLTLSLSGKLRTLNLTLNLNQHQREVQVPCESPPALSPCELAKPEPKPDQLQTPTGFASLSDKRKSLTLSLSPLGNTPSPPEYHPKPQQSNNNRRTACISAASQTVHKREMGAVHEATEHSAAVSCSPAQMAPKRRDRSDSRTKYAQSRGKGEREGRAQGKKNSCPHNTGKRSEPSTARKVVRDMNRGNVDRQQSAIVDQQPSTDTKPALSVAAESEDTSLEEQGLLSPLNLTFNKLLGWGERMMLGVLFAPRIKMGQAALPYRC